MRDKRTRLVRGACAALAVVIVLGLVVPMLLQTLY